MCPKKIITRFISRCQLWFSRIKQHSPTSLVVSSLPESCLLPGLCRSRSSSSRSKFIRFTHQIYRYHNGYSGGKKDGCSSFITFPSPTKMAKFRSCNIFHLFPTKKNVFSSVKQPPVTPLFPVFGQNPKSPPLTRWPLNKGGSADRAYLDLAGWRNMDGLFTLIRSDKHQWVHPIYSLISIC